MPDRTLRLQGGCRCAQVRFAVTAPPLLTMACHCRGCQLMTASAFSLSAAVPSDAFAVIAGDPVVGGLHGANRHLFCPHCKSWLFTRPAGMDGLVVLRAAMLDEVGGFAPFIETWTRERLPWARTPAVHSFPEFPPMEAYAGLMQAYQAQAAWP